MNLKPLGHAQLPPGYGEPLGNTATSDGVNRSTMNRYDRACARSLFAWRQCQRCGVSFRVEVGHECRREGGVE